MNEPYSLTLNIDDIMDLWLDLDSPPMLQLLLIAIQTLQMLFLRRNNHFKVADALEKELIICTSVKSK